MSPYSGGEQPSETGAVFVDRDGVINELVPERGGAVCESPLRVEDVRLIPGSADAIARLKAAGWRVFCVTNQPAAAKGTVPLAELEAIHARVIELLEAQGAAIDGSRLCFHHPDGVVAGLSGPCSCRKPAPGMLISLAAEHDVVLSKSWMIGDTDADMAAGEDVCCRSILVATPASAHKRSSPVDGRLVANDLAGAAELLLGAPNWSNL